MQADAVGPPDHPAEQCRGRSGDLGTAAGDLVSEQLGMGYVVAGAIFGGAIALITAGYYAGLIGSVLAFWSAYVLTRPLGASLGDFLTQAPKDRGLGLSTMTVSALFLAVIIALVAYLTLSKVDSLDDAPVEE